MGTRRRDHLDVSDAGQDSFLDIVANIVGILIILVIVVAVRAKNAPVALSIRGPDQQQSDRELEQDLATERSLHRAVLETAVKIDQVQQAKQLRRLQRSKLSLLTAAAQKMIDQRRGRLDTKAQADFDRRRQLAETRSQLSELQNQHALASRVRPEAVRVESFPTPLSKTVHGHELHLQLRGGRITVIPWEEIERELKTALTGGLNRMRGQSELTAKTRPIGGFRIRYTIERHDVSMRTYEKTGIGGSYVAWKFSLLPVSSQMGEPFQVALAPQSEFREALARCRPGRTTVTVWVYPDSFEQYRRLKKELYTAGYTVAGRPLPDGELIGGSPRGTRSAAQ